MSVRTSHNMTILDASTMLQVTWLPLPEPSLLIGLQSIVMEDGLAVILDAPQATALAEAFRSKEYFSHTYDDHSTLTVKKVDHAPEWCGMLLSISFEQDKIHEISFDDEHALDLAEMISHGLPNQ
jgi:hypothetical protein